MLTPTQLQTLQTDMTTNTNQVVCSDGVSRAIDAITGALQTPDNAAAIAAQWYNLTASPAYYVIRTDVPTLDIENAINYAKFTPNVAVTSQNAAQASADAEYIRIKQSNLGMLLNRPNQTTFDATHATNVKSLNDAVTNLPAGTSFAAVDAGWGTPTTGIMTLLSRQGLNIEKLLVTAAASTAVPTLYDGTSTQGLQGNPSLMGYQGTIAYPDVVAAWVGHY